MKFILLLLSLYLLCSFQKRPPRKKTYIQHVVFKGKGWSTSPQTYSDSVLALEIPPADSVWLNYYRKKQQ